MGPRAGGLRWGTGEGGQGGRYTGRGTGKGTQYEASRDPHPVMGCGIYGLWHSWWQEGRGGWQLTGPLLSMGCILYLQWRGLQVAACWGGGWLGEAATVVLAMSSCLCWRCLCRSDNSVLLLARGLFCLNLARAEHPCPPGLLYETKHTVCM